MNPNYRRKNELYGDWKILTPDNQLLYVGLKKSADWYLDRDLAEVVDEKTVRLLFEPKSRSNMNDPYMLSIKENKCVVCGEEELEKLTKHHIVPAEYRKLFPVEVKSRNCHDIVGICRDCHDVYEEIHANLMRELIAKEYDSPLNPNNTDSIKYATKLGNTIIKNCDVIPKERLNELYDLFTKESGIENPGFIEIEDFVEKYEDYKPKTHAEIVYEKILERNNLYDFVVMWRKNFLDTMKPKYMPEFWDVNRKLILP